MQLKLGGLGAVVAAWQCNAGAAKLIHPQWSCLNCSSGSELIVLAVLEVGQGCVCYVVCDVSEPAGPGCASV